MQANRALFLTKRSTYELSRYRDDPCFVHIPFDNTRSVPCILFKSKIANSKIMVYWHGMGEDLNEACEEMNYIRNRTNLHVLGVEYPGYGQNWGSGICTADRLLSEGKAVVRWLK